jgi:hypothetical protein
MADDTRDASTRIKAPPRRAVAKLKLLNRLLMSYIDFHHSSRIASYILDHRLQEKVARLHGRRRYRIKLLWEALNAAMIVAYCRPFSGNDRGRTDTLRELPRRFLEVLSPEELEIHREALEDRNQLIAHADSSAWNMRLTLLAVEQSKPVLLPLHSYAHAPLVHDAVVHLQSACTKLMDRILEERRTLEREVGEFLPTVAIEVVEDEEPSADVD